MAITVEERIEAAKHHLTRADEAVRAVSVNTPGAQDLVYAVAYLLDAVRDLARETRGVRDA